MRCRLLLIVGLLSLGLAGCGVKGPLYLPDADATSVHARN